MICFPNAKIDLGLNVVSEHPDGYHSIETIFYLIPVKDALEIVTSDRTCFTQTRIPVDALQKKNLVIKTLNALKTRCEIPSLEIHLLKVIPFGAGLGEDFADATFMLKLVNNFCGLDTRPDELEAIAPTIGADCPFFIRNMSVFTTGTKNQFEFVSLSLKDYYLYLVKPDIAVSIPRACSMVTPAAPETSLKEIIRLPMPEWKEWMVNDFERSVFPRHPVTERIKDTLYGGDASYATTFGSGSSVSGLFEKPTHFREQSPSSDCFLWEGQLS